MSRTFQNLELFLDLSARENMLAADDRRDPLAYITNLVMPGSRNLPPLAAELFDVRFDDILDRKVRDLPQGIFRQTDCHLPCGRSEAGSAVSRRTDRRAQWRRTYRCV